MMDAEKLREIYNARFTKQTDAWTTSDRRKTQRTTQKILKWLSKAGLSTTTPRVLDVGCADGNYTEAFRRLGCVSTGLDYSEVIIAQAKEKHPQCTFLHMNGFEPELTSTFDIIFCRGFSGFNTHDLAFIAAWANKYITHLNPDGFLVIGSMSNFSGVETETEIANHTRREIQALSEQLRARYLGIRRYFYFGWLSVMKKKVLEILSGKKNKQEYYIIFKSEIATRSAS